MVDKILNLKTFIQNSLPQCKVIISNVIKRTDYGNASLTVENLNNHLNLLKLDIVDNIIIGKECLCKKDLHLIKGGTDQLTINFINKIRSLRRLTDNFQAPNLASSITARPNDAGTSASQNCN